MKEKILLVDDEDSLRLTLKMRLADAGFDVRDAADGEQAIAALEAEPVDLVLLDINMPRMDGIETLGLIMQAHPAIDVIMLTGFADFSTAIDCLKKGAKDYLVKPIEVTELVTRARSILRAKNAEQSLGELQRRHNSAILFDVLPGLFSLQSMIDSLAQTKLSRDQEVLLGQVHAEAVRLLDRTSTLVQCGEADTIAVDLAKTDTDVDALMHTLGDRYERESAARGIQFQNKIGSGLVSLSADKVKIGYAFDILVGGALRLVDKKKKILFSTAMQDGELLMELHIPFVLGDMDPVALFPLFEEAAAASTNSRRKDLGFVIAKRIAEEHGGRIWIDSSTPGEVLVSISLPSGKS